MKRLMLVTCVAVLALPALVARADELSDLKKIVKEQEATTKNLLGRIETLESELSKSGGGEEGVLPKSLSWLEKVKVKGDFRYRHEFLDMEESDTDRTRHRIRARVGLYAEVNDAIDLGFRLATGSGDPVSTNQTLDDGFSNKDIVLDLAYVDYHPEQIEGFSLIAGKIKNPFYKPAGTELIWDGDLNLEGGAIKYVMEGDDAEVFVNLGGFWAEERSSDADTGLFGIQIGTKIALPALGEKGYIRGAAGYYDYGNVIGRAPLYDDEDSFGNTVDGGDNYMYDYDLLDLGLEVGIDANGLPIAIVFNYVQNTASGVQEDTGYLVGFTVGKCKDPGSWAFRYNYRDVEADAVIGVYTDSDFAGGGTDAKGHEIGLDYAVTKNVVASVSWFDNERHLAKGGDDFGRLQLDVAFKF